MNTENTFYVYEHWRPDEGVIFYVGKGHARRAYDWHRGRNRWHKFIVAKLRKSGLRVEVKIVHSGMPETDALAKERELIAHWRSLGADLVNLTDGGEGPSGLKHTEEWKQANSLRMKGRKMSPEARANMSRAAMGNKRALGCKRAPHLIEALRIRNTGRVVSQETRQKMSVSKRGQVRPHTAEEDARASARQKGIPKSDETRRRMSLHKKSDEHKRKLREFNLGKTHGAETRAKIAANSRLMWAQKRAERESRVAKLQLNLLSSNEEKT